MTAGEIALMSPELDAAKAEAYRASLAVARKQRAKSWELRAAMSMARLWRDQGKRNEARDLVAPVYGRFTEGFDTLDLKEALLRQCHKFLDDRVCCRVISTLEMDQRYMGQRGGLADLARILGMQAARP